VASVPRKNKVRCKKSGREIASLTASSATWAVVRTRDRPNSFVIDPRNARLAASQVQMKAMLAETPMEDDDLVSRAGAGDRAAFAALVERHYDFVHRVAWRCCGRKADAEDIAQEVCARLGKAIRSFRGEGRFTTWLYQLTLNAARDHGRRAARETARVEAYAVHALTAAPLAQTEPEDPADALWEAVRRLPAKQCEAVVLVYGEGLTHAAASDVMGCAEATVSWHIHEARKRLKALLRPAGSLAAEEE
jgi:RNA polymerase sigma-70 factor (ECF subfamily)